MSFLNEFTKERWEFLERTINSADRTAVERSLANPAPTVKDFCHFISPAAAPLLEQMAQESHRRTVQRFGRTIQLYAPLYLSNECSNICTYCGFSFNNKIQRKTLNDDEILEEVAVLKGMGFDHVLLVTGESARKVGVSYLENAIGLLRPFFSNISIEVQPLETDEYRRLCAAGVHAVLVYQETYDRESYKKHHPKGKKSNFDYRLETPDRLGAAGVHKIGLGALLGLSDWRVDAACVALHLNYLESRYWQTKFSISFPRLRPAEGIGAIEQCTSETDLVQLLCAYRLFNENVELSLSTRESRHFRDNAIRLGVTTMSAASKTEPGGYAGKSSALKQFETDDVRSAAEVATMIRLSGYEAVWKDWEESFDTASSMTSLVSG